MNDLYSRQKLGRREEEGAPFLVVAFILFTFLFPFVSLFGTFLLSLPLLHNQSRCTLPHKRATILIKYISRSHLNLQRLL